MAAISSDKVSARGVPNGQKTHCPRGHPYDETNIYRTTKGARRCRICHIATAMRWASRNPVRVREYGRASSFKFKHGFELELRDALIAKQLGRCMICTRPISGRGSHVDHDHITGHVRGVLCFSCNTGLGRFGDSIETLQKAIQYLAGADTGVIDRGRN